MAELPNNTFVATIFPKFIGRISYILRLLLVIALYEFGVFFIHQFPVGPALRLAMILILVAAFLGYLLFYIVLPRLRDFGLPPLALILFLIPILNTLLALGLMFGPQGYWEKLRRKTQR
jgi:hypothetical protein